MPSGGVDGPQLQQHRVQPPQKVRVKTPSRVNSATPWPIAYRAPLSMEFSKQEYWSGLPFHSPGDLPGPGIEPWSLTLQADALPSEPPGKPGRWQMPLLQLCSTLCDPMDCPWRSPGQTTEMGSLSLLQGIFLAQGWNPGLPHCRWVLYQRGHQAVLLASANL